MLMMLAMMTLVAWSRHFGLMWVAIEATTLSAGPLIYFNRTARSIEATWKYLLVGSVGDLSSSPTHRCMPAFLHR
jgi:hydrogenase-4 component F